VIYISPRACSVNDRAQRCWLPWTWIGGRLALPDVAHHQGVAFTTRTV
jgi:hypothetical protein